METSNIKKSFTYTLSRQKNGFLQLSNELLFQSVSVSPSLLKCKAFSKKSYLFRRSFSLLTLSFWTHLHLFCLQVNAFAFYNAFWFQNTFQKNHIPKIYSRVDISWCFLKLIVIRDKIFLFLEYHHLKLIAIRYNLRCRMLLIRLKLQHQVI